MSDFVQHSEANFFAQLVRIGKIVLQRFGKMVILSGNSGGSGSSAPAVSTWHQIDAVEGIMPRIQAFRAQQS